jgi:hypothetical protein
MAIDNVKGVTNPDWDDFDYGMFFNYDSDDFASQKVFDYERIRDNNCVLCLNGKMSLDTYPAAKGIDNLANMNKLGTHASEIELGTFKDSLKLYGERTKDFGLYYGSTTNNIDITYTDAATAFNMAEATTLTIAFKIRTSNYSVGDYTDYPILRIGTGFYLKYIQYQQSGQGYILLCVDHHATSGIVTTIASMTFNSMLEFSHVRQYLHGVVSIDVKNKKCTCCMYGSNDSIHVGRDIGIPTLDLSGHDIVIMDLIGGGGNSFALINLYNNMYLGNLTSDDEVKDVATNLLNSMPYFPDEWIGVRPSDTEWTDNINIAFEPTKDITNAISNEYRWSKIGSMVFPALYGKKTGEEILTMLPAPSFLKQQYENTIIIFTRNTISRMILSPNQDIWHTDSQNLIMEYSSFGLFAKKSLAKCGDNLFWLSESGVMRWSPSGLVNISKGKIIVPISQGLIGFYIPSNMQYALHDNSTQITYVFNLINDKWTTFHGLDVVNSAILDNETDANNDNLLIDSNNLINTYPSKNTIEYAYLKTKKYRIGNSKIIRMRIDAELIGETIVYTQNMYNLGQSTSASGLSRMHWHYLPNGVWGEFFQLRLDNADNLRSIEIDVQPMGV